MAASYDKTTAKTVKLIEAVTESLNVLTSRIDDTVTVAAVAEQVQHLEYISQLLQEQEMGVARKGPGRAQLMLQAVDVLSRVLYRVYEFLKQ